MQQEIPQDWDSSKYKCEVHKCQIQYLYFGDATKLKSKLLCINCVIDLVNTEKVQPSLVNLKDFLSNPLNQLIKITRINGSIIKTNEIEQLKELEKALSHYEEVVKQQIEMIRQNIVEFQEQFGQVGSEVTNNLKLNDIVGLFSQLVQMDSYQGTKELEQLEEHLNNISDNLCKTFVNAYQKVIDTKPKILEDSKDSLQTIEQQHLSLTNKTQDILQHVLQLGMPAILQQDLGGFLEIHQQISQGKLTSYQLIYQGTRDGLNSHQYWAKCNNKQNLLTVMTSKNGNRFGGYSPCLINSELNNYVQDPTMKSFLFQYNKKYICKLKSQAYAIYCNSGYGPTYGKDHDLYIAADFSGGHSKIGSYQENMYQMMADKSTDFFGASTPQLQECKVFKVIF